MIKIEVTCEMCGEVFQKPESVIKRTKHNFCSQRCCGHWNSANKVGANNPQSKRVTVSCAECGKGIIRKRYKLQRSKNFFCGKECRSKWQAKQVGDLNPTYKRHTVYCDGCGKETYIIGFAKEHFERHFCNLTCRGAWQSRAHVGENHPRWTRARLACEVCGKQVERQPNQMKDKEHVFCSKKCTGVWFSLHKSGERSHRWKGGDVRYYGPSWRQAQRDARARDKHRCCHCGVTEKKLRRKLDVHHIQPFRTFGYVPGENENHLQANDLTNLISLCSTCHKLAEHEHIPLQLALC